VGVGDEVAQAQVDEDVVPIPGTKRVSNLEQNLGSLDVSLSPDLMAELAKVRVAGERYPVTPGPAGIPGKAD
jgi:aryl-alcohol dehydrogenase-like predicted oxidoreductase